LDFILFKMEKEVPKTSPLGDRIPIASLPEKVMESHVWFAETLSKYSTVPDQILLYSGPRGKHRVPSLGRVLEHPLSNVTLSAPEGKLGKHSDCYYARDESSRASSQQSTPIGCIAPTTPKDYLKVGPFSLFQVKSVYGIQNRP